MIRQPELFGNYTYTDPQNVDPTHKLPPISGQAI
jgi:hypothetical protein